MSVWWQEMSLLTLQRLVLLWPQRWFLWCLIPFCLFNLTEVSSSNIWHFITCSIEVKCVCQNSVCFSRSWEACCTEALKSCGRLLGSYLMRFITCETQVRSAALLCHGVAWRRALGLSFQKSPRVGSTCRLGEGPREPPSCPASHALCASSGRCSGSWKGLRWYFLWLEC